mmetsp:Transcript_9629/g.36128  ORF Transcript_9629/g.36128 Transcript_9629/m.36128 type:complete len:489 (+) Transcript_9629:2609-4075(+)
MLEDCFVFWRAQSILNQGPSCFEAVASLLISEKHKRTGTRLDVRFPARGEGSVPPLRGRWRWTSQRRPCRRSPRTEDGRCLPDGRRFRRRRRLPGPRCGGDDHVQRFRHHLGQQILQHGAVYQERRIRVHLDQHRRHAAVAFRVVQHEVEAEEVEGALPPAPLVLRGPKEHVGHDLEEPGLQRLRHVRTAARRHRLGQRPDRGPLRRRRVRQDPPELGPGQKAGARLFLVQPVMLLDGRIGQVRKAKAVVNINGGVAAHGRQSALHEVLVVHEVNALGWQIERLERASRVAPRITENQERAGPGNQREAAQVELDGKALVRAFDSPVKQHRPGDVALHQSRTAPRSNARATLSTTTRLLFLHASPAELGLSGGALILALRAALLQVLDVAVRGEEDAFPRIHQCAVDEVPQDLLAAGHEESPTAVGIPRLDDPKAGIAALVETQQLDAVGGPSQQKRARHVVRQGRGCGRARRGGRSGLRRGAGRGAR